MVLEVVFSYSHKDEEFLKNLKNHLTPLQREGLIEHFWHDRNISAGAEWEKEIDKHLNTANIILLLVSSDFMASDYAYGIEMKRAIERHEKGEARVIPVIIRHVSWKNSIIGKLQAVPTDGKPVKSWLDQDEAFYNVAEYVRKVTNELIQQQAVPSQAGRNLESKNDQKVFAINKASNNRTSVSKDEHMHRVRLVERLNDAVEVLYETIREDKRFHMGIFLHQSVNINADEETLTRIIEDVENYTLLRKTKAEP